MAQNVTNKYFLSLLRCALRGEKPEKAPQGVDFNLILALARQQSVVELIAYAIPKIEPAIDPELVSKLERLKRAGIAREVNQDIELSALKDAFEGAGLDYMLLKGSVLKHLYPTPDMRSMCDIDILINSAGIITSNKTFDQQSESEIVRTMQINTIAPMFGEVFGIYHAMDNFTGRKS